MFVFVEKIYASAKGNLRLKLLGYMQHTKDPRAYVVRREVLGGNLRRLETLKKQQNKQPKRKRI